MRSAVARFWGGHPFEEKYLNLEPEQLFILDMDARMQRKAAIEDQVDLYNKVLNRFDTTFDNVGRMIAVVSNPEVYSKFKELEEMQQNREELTAEQAAEEMERMLAEGIIPEEINLVLPGDIQEEVDDTLVIPGLQTFDASLLDKMLEDE